MQLVAFENTAIIQYAGWDQIIIYTYYMYFEAIQWSYTVTCTEKKINSLLCMKRFQRRTAIPPNSLIAGTPLHF